MCDYLVRQGWEIEVYTEQFDALTFPHDYPIYEVKLYRGSRLDWALKAGWSLLTDWKNRTFSSHVRKLTRGKNYDAVFCTTFSTFPLRAAADAAEEKQLPLMVDIRDLDEQVRSSQYLQHKSPWLRPLEGWYRQANIRRRNRVLSRVNRITTVSPWHQTFLQQFNPNVELVYNGFNPRVHYPEDISENEFIISYIGRTYGPELQDPTLLLEALQQLKGMKHLRWCVLTDEAGQERFRQLTKAYQLEDITHISGYVPTNEVPQLYRRSSICVVLSNRTGEDGPFGMMTTKYFEIVGCEKPVLLVRSDETTLAAAIVEANAGLAATNKEQIVEFIREKYAEWFDRHYTRQPVRQSVRAKYSREEQAKQIEQLLIRLINPTEE